MVDLHAIMKQLQDQLKKSKGNQNKKVKYYRVLWDSQTKGTYVKSKHGELK